jgi:cell division protein FtsB
MDKKKNAVNAVKGKKKKKDIFFLNLLVATVVIISLFNAFNNYVKISQRNERLETLEREYNSLRIKNDALRNNLEISRERTLDEDYIVNFARANGLRKDNEILFYLNPEQ